MQVIRFFLVTLQKLSINKDNNEQQSSTLFWYFGKLAKMIFILQFSRFAKLTSIKLF
jgi:hypothetical protein